MARTPPPMAAHDATPTYGQDAELLRWPFPQPLLPGVLLRRRDRFLADVRLTRGDEVVAHCVNTGRMEGLTKPGRRVWLSESPDPRRRLRFTWELTEVDGVLVGTNTAVPNGLVGALLRERRLAPLAGFLELKSERRFGERSRVDFWLREPTGEHFVEVKNCHLVYADGLGYFPDSVSERATHHLRELQAVVAAGHRATVLFVVQRADARGIRPSDAHDPAFAAEARRAARAGVQFLALRVEPTVEALLVRGVVPVDLAPYDTARVRAWRDALRAEAPAWERTSKPGPEAAPPPEGPRSSEEPARTPAPRGPRTPAARAPRTPAARTQGGGGGGTRGARARSSRPSSLRARPDPE